MSMCVRYLDAKQQIREEFIDVERITGEVCFEVVKFYKRNDLHLEDLRGQCYDGASNMSAVKMGLSGRVLEINPQALYTHCTSHVLNLSITAACKENTIQMVLTHMASLAVFFKYFSKSEKLLEHVVEIGT